MILLIVVLQANDVNDNKIHTSHSRCHCMGVMKCLAWKCKPFIYIAVAIRHPLLSSNAFLISMNRECWNQTKSHCSNAVMVYTHLLYNPPKASTPKCLPSQPVDLFHTYKRILFTIFYAMNLYACKCLCRAFVHPLILLFVILSHRRSSHTALTMFLVAGLS